MNRVSDGPISDWIVPMIGDKTGDEHRRPGSL
jgi:hypothetical protein